MRDDKCVLSQALHSQALLSSRIHQTSPRMKTVKETSVAKNSEILLTKASGIASL